MNFKSSMHRRAALQYPPGDARPVNALSANFDFASFCGPDGTVLQGSPQHQLRSSQGRLDVRRAWHVRLEIVQCEASGNVGYRRGLRRAAVEMEGTRMLMALRITELFRRENRERKLVYRQADTPRNRQ